MTAPTPEDRMTPLLAQFNQPQGPPAGPPPEFWVIFLGLLCVAFAIALAINVFFLLTLSRALRECGPDARTIEPGMVWLYLIPLFNLYWVFVLGHRVPESLGNEFRDRRTHRRGEDYGEGVGRWYAITSVLGIVPIVNYIAGPAALVLFILFWVKVAGFGRQLREGDRYGGDDEYDDDPPPQRRSRRGYDDEDDRPRSRRDREFDEDDDDDRPRR